MNSATSRDKKRPARRAAEKLRVFVGMSGGVDSSVSAALLKRAGHDVTGVFIKAWHPDFLPCSWREERLDAMRVAAALDIPFVTLDLEKEYKRAVVDYMIAEYAAGRTPNPDVVCNQAIKFGAFFDKAMALGADAVATGHYAQVVRGADGLFELHEAVDEAKEQSYFLWTLGQRQLSKTLFPVGGMKKSQVRALARRFKLPVAEKKDSQGLCFLGHVDMAAFLSRFIETAPGPVIDAETGKAIGRHEGAALYTIGQRHGFIIDEKGVSDRPRYVVARDVASNSLVVSTDRRKGGKNEKGGSVIRIDHCSWVSGAAPSFRAPLLARIRYHQAPERCVLEKDGPRFVVRFAERQEAVSAGQSLVLYDGKRCLGGGIIEG